MQLSLRFVLRLVYAFLNKFKAIILFGSLIGAILFFLIGNILPRLLERKSETIGVQGRYHTNELPLNILNQISNGLTKINEKGEVVPDLAESWEQQEDGKIWIFHLRDDLVWQNQTPLVAMDINYNFSDVSVDYPDDQTIKFTLNDEYAFFPNVVARPIFNKGLLGTGAWLVKNIRLSGSNVQELKIQNNGHTKIYKFYPTESSLNTAFKLGRVKKIESLLKNDAFRNWRTANIEEFIDDTKIVIIFFNNQDKLTSDKSFRQGLIYALNKDQFNGTRAISPISPSSSVYNPQVKKYDYDAERAREIIDDLPDELREGLVIKLVSTPALLEVAEIIKQDWQKVGVESQILVSSIIPDDFQAYLTILDMPVSPDQYTLWHSTQTATNISKYTNPRIDKLLEDGRTELDVEARKKIYLDFQRFLLEDSPAAFLYHPTVYQIERK